MNNDDARAAIQRYRNSAGKPTAQEYMAYMRARQHLGERLTAGQRGLLAAASRPLQGGEGGGG